MLQGPLGSGNFLCVKYLIHQLQLESKQILLLTITMWVVALQLSPHVWTIHSMFRILVKGYLKTIIIEPSSTLEIQANWIVLHEMSMIKKITFCLIEQCLKQCFQNDVDSNFILVILVGDLSQFPSHSLNGSGKYRIWMFTYFIIANLDLKNKRVIAPFW
jgi:hypothetical protein